nr:long-chain fatty acid--CoA ligase [Actinomycetota bacterium]
MVGADVVAARAGADPGGVALTVEGGDDLTYGPWEVRSNAVARGLAARGVGAGDRVGLRFDASHWALFAAAHLGVLKAGGVAVLLSPGAATLDLVRAISHSGVVGMLCNTPALSVPPPVWVAHPEEVAAGRDTGPVLVP